MPIRLCMKLVEAAISYWWSLCQEREHHCSEHTHVLRGALWRRVGGTPGGDRGPRWGQSCLRSVVNAGLCRFLVGKVGMAFG